MALHLDKVHFSERHSQIVSYIDLLLFRLDSKAILHVQQTVAGKHVGPCLHTALGVYVVGDVAEAVQQVETVNHEYPPASFERIAKSGVPHDIGCVERRIAVPSAVIHSEIR